MITDYEYPIRVAVFLALLAALGIWEGVAPRRSLSCNKSVRWFSNLALLAINSLMIRLMLAGGAVGVAWVAEIQHWGLFNLLTLPSWLEVALAVVALDFSIYLQHVLFHALPFLWRFHRVHHADPDFDVTTGLRFHTIEIGLSMGIKAAAILALGASPLAVMVFEILLNATSMFSHSNVKMPEWLDRMLRLVLVTPDMHRVHHSIITEETNSNFGFNLPWWDFLLGTYRAIPRYGQEQMRIGVAGILGNRAVWLHWLLILPFVRSQHPSEDNAGES